MERVFVTALNSGSNGNCYYVGNDSEAVLIDVGISCREIEKRMKRLDLSIQNVKAIFISHEHSDHIKGLRVFSKKHKIPVFISLKTLAESRLYPVNPYFTIFKSNDVIEIQKIRVIAFSKLHDAADPHSFMISSGSINIGVFTDIGEPCENVIHHFSQCHAAFLETNYDDNLLESGYYPYYLKQRIKSKLGHLSNEQAYQLFLRHRSEKLSHLFLSHISKDNNHPEIITNLFAQNQNGTKIILTSRYEEIPVFEIRVE